MRSAKNAPRWLNEQEREAWRNFTLMQFQLLALLGRRLADDGLSYQDYVVLAELADRPDGQARFSDLGRQLGWEKSRVSHHVARMEARGLLARVKCPTDQRGWNVTATDEGRAAIKAAAPAHVGVVRQNFIDLLTAEQIDVLNDISATVLAKLGEAD
jgi:DNA-binding MarR family transcriptional regulator